MDRPDPAAVDRRSGPRRPPRYTPDEASSLRITRVHFRGGFLFCLLSDGNMVCVPLAISPMLQAAPEDLRYRWQITDDGKAMVWYTGAVGVVTERVSLADILAHPEAQITELPSP